MSADYSGIPPPIPHGRHLRPRGPGHGGAHARLGPLLRPTRPQEQKYITYESGVDPVGTGWSQSQVRYYIFALLFVMFDVEAVFIFPWATRLESTARSAWSRWRSSSSILALGLVYAWRKKVLRWV